MAANRKKYNDVVASPNQCAKWAATMKVAPASPYNPRMDGAAIGSK